ncbi:MAG: hypothetical protein ACD_50C00193G0002 [uncultured bacterium]|nr:MAG: hypothetical protein ACD_50C00193G0002 [uncultured bacterium]
MSNYWFRSKYGLGWYPTTFKGLAVLILYFSFLLSICYITGEPLRKLKI